MKQFDFKDLTERQQVVAIILMAGAMISLLWFFALTPLNQNRRRLTADIENMEEQLARKNYLLGEAQLLQQKKDAEDDNRLLYTQWTQSIARVTTFTNREALAEAPSHIGFRVSLEEARRRLRNKAARSSIELPPDLGMDTEVRSYEDAQILLVQLRTVEKLVDMAIDLQIDEVTYINPLPAVKYKAPGSDRPYVEEYPVLVEFYAQLADLYDVLEGVFSERHVFVVKNLKVEALDPRTDLLRVTGVVAALLFPGGLAELAPPERTTVRLYVPTGF
jgi:hypothetical protein